MRSICVFAALLAAPLMLCAQDAPDFAWQGDIQPDQTVEIRNINGSIRAEPATGSQLEILARITGTRPAPQSVRIHIEPHPGGYVACTIYEGLSAPNYCTPEMTPNVNLQNSDIRVEYTVKVPAGMALLARTVNGRITAHLPGSAITADTVNGRVVLSTATRASAKVVNGSIVASLNMVNWDGAQEFRTVNGSIDVELNEQAEATVAGATVLGAITTEFPIPVKRWFIGSSLKGKLNGGGSRLELSTVSGSIHLNRL